ncbi:potassium channel family protein [Sphingomonas cannabina]|uniref:potassium channel family protein n=1 Tax=Sphingomonas cannabina TaxID=2899123 RepID=UPI0038734340
MAIEGHNFADSLYWAGTAATSTGYGDISPKSTAGEMLALALMHLSIFGVVPLIVVRLIERLNQDRDAFTHEEQVRIPILRPMLAGSVIDPSLRREVGRPLARSPHAGRP